MHDRLFKAVDARTDDLVALTADLIRFPTVNPPGEAYRPCAEYVGERLKKRGFGIEYLRGEGAPGDTDRHPRIN
ncbi:MAG: succinyl-diaminopimelate desuccinylase, partial [Mesorhizobium sp.]|nr:succinyl-diaminopimelate desuccinylase [Mesorhizobium sp.]